MILKVLNQDPVSFLDDTRFFVNIIVGTQVWAGIGWGSIIYLAAIANIDLQLYEAAILDGANKWQQIWYITIPCISGVMAIILIFNIGGLLNANFEYIVMLYTPQTYSVADVIDTYVYREGLTNANYSFTTAVGLFKSVITVLLIVGANKLANLLGYEGIW